MKEYIQEKNHINAPHAMKAFLSMLGFTAHEIPHREVKPYLWWSMCRKCFGNRHVWLRHEQIHLGEEGTLVPPVGRGFSSSSGGLLQHRRIYMGEMPYKYSIYGKGFHRKNF